MYSGIDLQNKILVLQCKKYKNFAQFRPFLHALVTMKEKFFPLKVVKNKKCELFLKVSIKIFFFQVSWMRHDDTQLLAIGRLTYTSDMRFKAIHKLYSEDYLLQIKPTTHRDSGKYTCQISTTPPISHIVTLTIAGT